MRDLAEMQAKAADCADLYGVERTESFLSDDRKRLICVFNAPDCEAVRKVQEVSGAPYTAVFPAELVAPKQP